MDIQPLPKEFIGTGEVKGMMFNQVFASKERYIYEVKQEDTPTPHYEVFDRKTTPICIDFENRVYSETEHKEVYPKSKDFGVWAWTFNNLQTAKDKLNEN